MGTGNFLKKNASKYYAVMMAWEDDDGEVVHPDDMDYEWMEEGLVEGLELKGKSSSGYEGNRNYPEKVVGWLSKSRMFMGLDVEVMIEIVVRSGYYEGCNLDWNLYYTVEGDETDDYEDVLISLEGYCDNLGLAKANGSRLIKWIRKVEDELIEKVEGFFDSYTTPLDLVARFSNGETIYKEILK